MTPEQRQRKAVRKWRAQLLDMARTVKGRTVRAELYQLHALDIAMIESAFYGMAAQWGEDSAHRQIADICQSCLASFGNVRHWRNREAATYPDHRNKVDT